MDPQTDLGDLVEDLEVNIDELTTALAPLVNTPLHTTAASLPLLDKAKLYVLAAYSIESLLFSTLQASGANAKEHALFPELARLKKYFAKIKDVEERAPGGVWEKRARVDTGAAARFIKHGLAGNDRYDAERQARTERERERAQEKAKLVNKKFDDDNGDEVTPKKRAVEHLEEEDPEAHDDADADAAAPAKKKTRMSASDFMDDAPAPVSTPASQKKERKQRGKGKKAQQPTETSSAETDENATQASPDVESPPPAPGSRQRRTPRSKSLKGANGGEKEETTLPSRAPKTRSSTAKGRGK